MAQRILTARFAHASAFAIVSVMPYDDSHHRRFNESNSRRGQRMSTSPREDQPLSPGRLLAVCAILLSATLINYACRTTFNQNSLQIQTAFRTGDDGYGQVEGLFGLGFACGGLLFGYLSDKVNVRWLYPAVMLAWSLAGAAAAWVESLTALGVSRFLLGLFEAGHWPCALRTTQRVFKPAQRTWGNSLLQSGASLGAILTPLLIAGVHHWNPEQWRLTFVITGLLSLPWVVAWLWTLRDSDMRRTVIATDEAAAGAGEERELETRGSWWDLLASRRWLVLVFITISINTTWQFIRVWLPSTLEKQHGYDHEFVQFFTSGYYAATCVGSIGAGWLVGWFARRQWNVHRARVAVFSSCSLLVAWLVPTAFFEPGWIYLGSWLLIGVGALGVFPVYYSLNQELSASHQGRVSGSLSFSAWVVQSFVHPAVGQAFKQSPEARPYLFASIGVLPLLALAVLVLFWGKRES
jgi:MFS transporter, ACS family, aldohexuronate transporter